MKKKYLETGKIVGTHGIKGMVRVQPWSDSGDFLTKFNNFYLDDGAKKLEVVKVQPHGNIVLIAFKGITTVETAESLRNKLIFIDRDEVELPDGRYFIDDLLGCTVTDADTNEVLGKITDVSATGANDVWHITRNNKEYLVPVIEQVVVSVDTDNEEVVIRPLKGIFDDED